MKIEYRTFSLDQVREAINERSAQGTDRSERVQQQLNAEVKAALAAGFVWIRTDGTVAVFERVTTERVIIDSGGIVIDASEVAAYEFVNGGDLRVVLKAGAEFTLTEDASSAYQTLSLFIKGKRDEG